MVFCLRSQAAAALQQAEEERAAAALVKLDTRTSRLEFRISINTLTLLLFGGWLLLIRRVLSPYIWMRGSSSGWVISWIVDGYFCSNACIEFRNWFLNRDFDWFITNVIVRIKKIISCQCWFQMLRHKFPITTSLIDQCVQPTVPTHLSFKILLNTAASLWSCLGSAGE
jgi:hypothetical protein